MNFLSLLESKRDGHAAKDHGDAENFQEVQFRAEPEPFNHDGRRRREALREQNGSAAAQPRARRRGQRMLLASAFIAMELR